MVCNILLRSVKLEIKIKLVLAVASLFAAVFGLIMGELWPAVVCALGACLAFGSYRWNKRELERQQ
jgi:hypothetical protein